MCGIFGAISLNGFFNEADHGKFTGLTDMVSYRGPDASGYEAFDCGSAASGGKGRFNVFLGHRRLSIIDLSDAGRQPFTDGEGLWITFNGEIFNYIELREELKKKGHVFKTETDTEVILKLYRECSEDGFGQLNGMWAFAIFDTKRQRVVLSRDRFSIKPLYFHRSNEGYFFASEIKQLLPLLQKKELNRATMFSFLKQGLLDFNTETFFEGVFKVKPMHNVVIDLRGKGITEKKYWGYTEETPSGSAGDLIERFRGLFIDSVKIRLRSDVPVGCLLSGGLDSSSIAVVADKMTGRGIECFSVVSSEKKYSEERFIDILGRSNNLRTTKLFLKQQTAWDYLEKTVWHQDEPFCGLSAAAQRQILEMIRETGIKVVLSGQGGDETLCGYRKFFFFHIRNAMKRGGLKTVFADLFFSLINHSVIWQFTMADAKRYIGRFQRAEANLVSRVLNYQRDLEPVWDSADLRIRQIADIDRYSVPALAHYEDRNSMAHAIEVRHPFLDHRLVNFALNLPDALKIRRGWMKYVLREAITELPSEVAWRRDKQGFITPEERWLREDFRGKILALFKSSKMSEMGLINKDRLMEMYGEFLRGNRLIAYADISRFVIAELWSRRFLS